MPVISVASAKDQKHCRYRLNRFRDYLIENADAPARSVPPLNMSPRACLKREYETYLNIQRGLSQDTIYHCLRFFDRFLIAKFGTGLGDLNTIKPDDITGFILRLRQEQNAPRDKTGPSHLRNLFQFLFWSGKTDRNLSKAVPRARQPKPSGIPRFLEPEQVNRLIDVVRNHKKTGRRNYAMLMLIARLGLRAPEVKRHLFWRFSVTHRRDVFLVHYAHRCRSACRPRSYFLARFTSEMDPRLFCP